MRRKAQGAIEYLFMIAAALIVIYLVIRALQGKSKTATSTTSTYGSSAAAELSSLANQTA